jgi:amidohydrolase family protein
MKKRSLVALVLTVGCAHQPARQPASRTYVMTIGANRAGTEAVTTSGNLVTTDFQFNDRGRGPKTHTVATIDNRGLLIAEQTTGNDYLKSPVDERLSLSGGKLTWKNNAESGSSDANGFFVGMYSPPEETAILARALLAAPGQRLPLLPAGEAAIRKVGELDVDSGGRKAHVSHYAISGLGFTPADVWLDAQNDFFASVSSWSTIVREGFESVSPRLLKSQDDVHAAEVTRAAARLTHKPAGGLLAITNARLFDPVTLQTTPATTILIRGQRVASVGHDGAIAIAAGTETIDARGRTVIPGLWDMHVHLQPDDGLLDIANGITTVRDLANDIDFVTDERAKFDSGAEIGPHVILAGFLDGPGPYTGPTKVIVDNEVEIRKAIDRYASLGYEQIKIYSSIRPELVPFIARYSHEHGMRVSGHIPAFMRAEEAVRAGYDEIQHTNMLFLNFMPDVKDTRTPVRFTAVADRGAALDLASPEVRRFIELLKNRPCDPQWDARTSGTRYHCQTSIVIDPTLAIFESMFTARQGTVDPVFAPVANRFPSQVRRTTMAGGLPVPEGKDVTYRESFRNMTRLVRALYDNGVPIVAGTDGLADFMLPHELEIYAGAGIPAPVVLRIATLGAATVMHRENDSGSVAPGKIADLVILDGDPTTTISDVRKVVKVVKDGNVFDPTELDREIGVLP